MAEGQTTQGVLVTPSVRWFHIVGICALAYLILLNYEIVRASTESLFLETHGSGTLPWVWTAVAIAAAVVTVIYGWLAQRVPLSNLFVGAVAVSAGLLLLLLWCRGVGISGATFALYVWKDVHIVVLLEMLWTFANMLFQIRTARWLYGVFCVAGSLGSLTGGFAVGAIAHGAGTANGLLFTLPVFAVIALIGMAAARHPSVTPRQEADPRAKKPSLSRAVGQLRRSDYLWWMLALIIVVQIVITLVDYQYNVLLEQAYPNTDERTLVTGRVYSLISVGAITLQLLSGVLLRVFGVPAILLAVPVLVGTALCAGAAVPRFAVMAAVKVGSKAFDYSLFKSAKEILYIPLSHSEKTGGKAAVDMFGYRFAKGAASLLLTGLVAVSLTSAIPWFAVGLVLGWIALTVRISASYRRRISRAEELHGAERQPR